MGVKATFHLEPMQYDEDAANRILHSFLNAIEEGAEGRSKYAWTVVSLPYGIGSHCILSVYSGRDVLPLSGLPPAATKAVYTGSEEDAITAVKNTGSDFYECSSPH
jgi:hypothetical protein